MKDAFGNLRVVLVAARNPLNIGAAARAMSNFGFRQLRVVAPYDAAFREARSAVGAPELLKAAEEYQNVPDAVADCAVVVGTTAVRSRALLHPLHDLREGASLIHGRLSRERVAILFGSEKRGLSKDDLSHCHWLMRIPTVDANLSMNLGQAVAVCLYELAQVGMSTPKESAEVHAHAAQLERMTLALFDGLVASGYVKRNAEATALEKARRLVRRMSLSPEDAETWTGALSKMAQALRRQQQ
jgi:TrmH family RNA methyltransferase